MIESRDIKHMACVERIKELEKENKKLRAYADNLDSENDNQAIEIEELKKENKKLKSYLDKYKKYYDRDKEELMESCYSLAKENDELKSDLEECECSMHFENDEVGYRKRECKKLKEDVDYRHHRAMVAERQVQHSLGGDDEEGLYD